MVTGDTVAMGDMVEVMVTEGIDVMAMGDGVMDENPKGTLFGIKKNYYDNTPHHFVLSISHDVCNFYFLLQKRNKTMIFLVIDVQFF